MEVSSKTKFKLFSVFAICYVFFYVFPNFYPLFEPKLLPLFEIDITTPFLPWTFIIYLSDYVLMLTVIIRVKHPQRFMELTRMCFLVLFLSGFFFLFFPTAYPRPPYPNNQLYFIQLLMTAVENGDTPNNCFPSMHVGLTAIGAWNMRAFGKKVLFPYTFWAILIFLSTMTTKQHYLLDVFGGLLTAMAAIGIENKFKRLNGTTLLV